MICYFTYPLGELSTYSVKANTLKSEPALDSSRKGHTDHSQAHHRAADEVYLRQLFLEEDHRGDGTEHHYACVVKGVKQGNVYQGQEVDESVDGEGGNNRAENKKEPCRNRNPEDKLGNGFFYVRNCCSQD